MTYYNECGGFLRINNDNIFTRHIIIENGNIESVRRRFNNTDCYISAYQYNIPNQEEADLYGSFYLDLDYNIQNDNDLKIIQYDLKQCVSFLRNQCEIPIELINIYFFFLNILYIDIK